MSETIACGRILGSEYVHPTKRVMNKEFLYSCDIFLEVQECLFPSFKNVLVSSSPNFKSMETVSKNIIRISKPNTKA